MFKNKRNLVILVVTLFVAILVMVYNMYNKPHRNIHTEKAVITIKANDLFLTYEQNEIAANSKFLDKTIEVTGEISELNISAGENSMIVFKSEEDFFGVSCSFNNELKAQLTKLNKGDFVKVKGICKGYLSDVVLINCIIVN